MTVSYEHQREFDEQLVLAILLDNPMKFQWEIASLHSLRFHNPLLGEIAAAMVDLQASGRRMDYRRVGRMVDPSLRSSVHALYFRCGAEFGLEDALTRLKVFDRPHSRRVTVPLTNRSPNVPDGDSSLPGCSARTLMAARLYGGR